eukprot:jgi/Hompol1/4233/HPOL_001181-RA
MSYRVSGLYPYLSDLVTEIFHMQDFWDADLQDRAAAAATYYPNFIHTPRLVDKMMRQLLSLASDGYRGGVEEYENETADSNGQQASAQTAVVESARWHLKVRVLPVIQVLFFRHLHLLSNELVDRVLNDVKNLLNDRQLEVRQLASITLAGLIRCSQHPESIAALIEQFSKQLRSSMVTKRQRGAGTSQDAADALVKRHASVLGLAAIVQAFPYTVPKWMPAVLVSIANCTSDPEPIRVSVCVLLLHLWESF